MEKQSDCRRKKVLLSILNTFVKSNCHTRSFITHCDEHRTKAEANRSLSESHSSLHAPGTGTNNDTDVYAFIYYNCRAHMNLHDDLPDTLSSLFSLTDVLSVCLGGLWKQNPHWEDTFTEH